MSLIPETVVQRLRILRAAFTDDEARTRLSSRGGTPAWRLRPSRSANSETIARNWDALCGAGLAGPDEYCALADAETVECAEAYARNIENMIGTVKVPVGIVGPLRVNGVNANGDYCVPMATTEAALVASYARGAEIVTAAGGASAAMVSEGVLRAPGFAFAGLSEAGLFIDWIARNADGLRAAAEATTSHGKLVSIEPVLDNDLVFLMCRYTTGDASGQNMVTIATDALCGHIETNCPIKPRHWFVEVNFSGDKKASYLGLIAGRGRKVTASVVLSAALVEKKLHTSVGRMLDYARMANLGALLSGQIGAQGHYANGLAALYLATGQDVACVAESAVGFSRMEDHAGDLFVSVTLPNILVGTVGGGTGLPSQSAALRLLGLAGPGKAPALAEVTAALCLGGEISIIGALAAGHFTRAHKSLARGRI
ncbi:hydroxymethylglutaryl-CoA reductase [Rhodoblastus sp.]|uniref:hydroxymethylglutaryl-CoA reductase n=1 Tax=Rhodoblastus sp. TaxID=1962975 RepID=UPI003F9B80AF